MPKKTLKLILLSLLLSSCTVASTIAKDDKINDEKSEFIKECKEDNLIGEGISAGNQTEYNAISVAKTMAISELASAVYGSVVDREKFLGKYAKKFSEREEIDKTFVDAINIKVKGIIMEKFVEVKFIPSGKVNENGEKLGKAKVKAKLNCNSRFYREFKRLTQKGSY